jgi:hypothetical protein
MAVSFLAAGASDVLVKEADACPFVKFDALSIEANLPDMYLRLTGFLCFWPNSHDRF